MDPLKLMNPFLSKIHIIIQMMKLMKNYNTISIKETLLCINPEKSQNFVNNNLKMMPNKKKYKVF